MLRKSSATVLSTLVYLSAMSAAVAHPSHQGESGAVHILSSWSHSLPLLMTGFLAAALFLRTRRAWMLGAAATVLAIVAVGTHAFYGHSLAFTLQAVAVAACLAGAGYGLGATLSRRRASRGVEKAQ